MEMYHFLLSKLYLFHVLFPRLFIFYLFFYIYDIIFYICEFFTSYEVFVSSAKFK